MSIFMLVALNVILGGGAFLIYLAVYYIVRIMGD